MKRIIFGFAVIVLAAAAAAFTTPTIKHDKLLDSYFEFDEASFTPNEANVEDESKWIQVADLNNCNNSNTKACRIQVGPTHVSGSTLLSNTNIDATASSSTTAYVVGGNIVALRNKN